MSENMEDKSFSDTKQVTKGTKKKSKIECSNEKATQTIKLDYSDLFMDSNLPLLHKIIRRNKTYLRLNIKEKKVIKGPYKDSKTVQRLIFRHSVMRNILNDSCTLNIETISQGATVCFPLVLYDESKYPPVPEKIISNQKSESNHVVAGVADEEEEHKDITRRVCYYVDPKKLGIVTLNHLTPEQIRQLPLEVIMHFVWRYLLNIGDTGFYNIITTKDGKEIYGVDLDENRTLKKTKSQQEHLANMLLVKHPAALLFDAFKDVVEKYKAEILLKLMAISIDDIKSHAEKIGYVHYIHEVIQKRYEELFAALHPFT